MADEKKLGRKFFRILFSPVKSLGSLFATVLSSVVLFSGMVLVIFISCRLPFRTASIIISSLTCALFSAPLTLIWRPRIRELIKKTDDKNQVTIENQRSEINALKNLVANQKSNEENLQSKIHLLENLVFNSQSSVDILKVGYKEYTKTSTIRVREKLNETGGKLFTSPGYDEAILILDCKIKYQRGIDFKNLHLNYQGTNKDAVIVTNLKPEYTSQPVFEYETFFREIRHVETDKNGSVKKISVLKDSDSNPQLNFIEKKSKENFESSFMGEENSESIEETNEILKISKDCIRLLLKPYFSKIDFDTFCEMKDAKPWTEFLQQQVDNYKRLESK